MEITGKRALITGATGGLGRAIALALADAGATCILSSRKPDELEALAAELPGSGHATIPGDLAVEGDAERIVEAAGEIDILVANAGLPGTGLIERQDRDRVVSTLRVNLEGPVLMARAVIPAMRERGEGSIVFVSSLAGKAPSPRSSIYNATKFGLRAFGFALREDLHGSGVGVSLVLPGFIRDAGMFHDGGGKSMGLGTASPEDVGAAVIKAVTKNRREVEVAPIQQRMLAGVGLHMPGVALRVQRGAGTRAAERLTEGQQDKR
jgi:short-subunit dehydrogenase